MSPIRLKEQTVISLKGYLTAVAWIAATTAVLAPLSPAHVNATTVALALLLAVLLTALGWGSRPAVLASVLGMLCFNYFFLPPTGTLTIADPQNWMALGAFLVTAITVGELSARAKRRAMEAETGKREIERLYEELRDAFERASEAEALRRSEQLKSALLDAVTHDLRTPLTAIKVSATALLDELGSTRDADVEGQREMLGVIVEEADRLNHFIESMVELARIEAGALDLSRRWSAFEEIVQIAVERAGNRLLSHRIVMALDPDLPLLRADARALAEVVYTLIENAAKYSPPATAIRVTARQMTEKPGEEMIEFAVEDEGPGIPTELRERVFDKFYRASDAGKMGPSAGLGMGLAIARGIVEAHGGRIRIEAGAGGRGARVVLIVPTGDEDKAETAGDFSDERTSTHSGG
ncbi:MAG: sensor histidine kinase [Blastocatellia bacterium]